MNEKEEWYKKKKEEWNEKDIEQWKEWLEWVDLLFPLWIENVKENVTKNGHILYYDWLKCFNSEEETD